MGLGLKITTSELCVASFNHSTMAFRHHHLGKILSKYIIVMLCLGSQLIDIPIITKY